MQTLAQRLASVHDRIRKAESHYNRPPGSVRLLAVSKKKSAATVEAAFRLGQTDFGENYLQDALVKIAALHHLPLCWHFIGQLQSNKTRQIAQHFDWVHSIDRIKLAQRLNDQRPENFKPLNVCIQVMLDDEGQKAGMQADLLLELALAVSRLPRMRLRGLMAIPRPQSDLLAQRGSFRRLKKLQEMLAKTGDLELDTLSMGMSEDFEAAIAEGATMVRVGTAVFGPRE